MSLGLDAFVPPDELITDVRPLRPADLVQVVATKRPSTGRPESAVKRLSARHRLAARLIAEGKSNIEVANICGYTPQNIVILKQAPAMQDLIKHFQEEADVVYRSVNERLSEVAGEALDLLMDKIENDPEAVSLNQAIELVKLGADRTGNGPQRSQNVNVTVDIADRLQAARNRVAEYKARQIIDVTPDKP